ncbi:MAG: hypothetical protein U0790_10940 [Isosphaeraceae bacterium]
MDDQTITYAIAGIIASYFLGHVLARKFDPFAPVWLFLVGYVQVYVVQATSYREWGINTRGVQLVTSANLRALWALLWFLAVYHMPIGSWLAARLPRPPRSWPPSLIVALTPPLVIWGLYCSRLSLADSSEVLTPEQVLLRSFPFLMMVAAVMLIVTGRSIQAPRPAFLIAGLMASAFYTVIWMFNGKRSPALIGVLATVCAWYISRLRRPSWPVLFATSCAGVLVVAIAIGWRNNPNYEASMAGFVQYLSEFDPQKIRESLNLGEEEDKDFITHESTEYGGFLLMMDTVPMKADYDYGANYIRTFSTFIPRIVWPDKPIFGRAKWQAAWVAGSEIDREEDFTSPAIGILGAAQLNGGALGTLIVISCVALLQRTAYQFFRRYQDQLWVQFWWAITYFNAWFMVVNDDPMVWFYYNWGYTTFPIVALLWVACRFVDSQTSA